VIASHFAEFLFHGVDYRGECVEGGLLGRVSIVELDGFGGRHCVFVLVGDGVFLGK
jgi:phage/plasmid primase-like uncharacterized protein